MTRLYPIALMLMTALTVLPAQAADWRFIPSTSSNNETHYVDYDSLKRHSFKGGWAVLHRLDKDYLSKRPKIT